MLALSDIHEGHLEGLTEEERAEFERLYGHLIGREGLAEFITRLWPDEPPPPHLMPLIRLIERARTERVRACISIPARHGKTITLGRALAWWLSNWPADTCAYTTYSDRKAWSKSVKFRDMALKAGVAPARPNTGQEWRTAAGGGLLAAGAGGSLTGEGVHGLMIVDDPFSNPAQAESPVIRERVWDWFNGVPMTRLEGASVIVVHTRWNEDDLIGKLAALGGWEVINLPALAETGDVLGRGPGEALWQSRFPKRHLERLRIQMGDYLFEAMYQGNPRPRGSRVFGDAHYYDPHTVDFTGARASIGADPATGKKTGLDFSAAVAMAIKMDKEGLPWVYILDVFHRAITIPAFARALVSFQRRNYGAPINLETVGAFAGVSQIMRESEPNILLNELEGADLEGNKFLRSQRFAAAWNAGRVLIPSCIGPGQEGYNPSERRAPAWVPEYLAELKKFTGIGDAKDDQVDASAHAFNPIVRTIVEVQRGAIRAPGRYV